MGVMASMVAPSVAMIESTDTPEELLALLVLPLGADLLGRGWYAS